MGRRRENCWLAAAFLACASVALCSAGDCVSAAAGVFFNVPESVDGLPLIFSDDFESGRPDRWEPSDPKAWKVAEIDRGHALSLFGKSDTKPPVRSPFNRSLVKDVIVGDFVLEAHVQSTTRDYPHRDVCLFFGFQDPAHLYYVHLGKRADPHAHSVFLVNDEPRISIADWRTDGIDWDDDWHRVRIVRLVDPGTIEVYFDDFEQPIMTASDKHFTWGQVGVGSFDDTANFDNVRLWGQRVDPKNP